jgi:hypothetical protein
MMSVPLTIDIADHSSAFEECYRLTGLIRLHELDLAADTTLASENVATDFVSVFQEIRCKAVKMWPTRSHGFAFGPRPSPVQSLRLVQSNSGLIGMNS